jgi:hypothetical protein
MQQSVYGVKQQYNMKLKYDRKFLLYFYVVKVVCSEEGINKKPKHVANYCKQKGICLPVKLCRRLKDFFSHLNEGGGG